MRVNKRSYILAGAIYIALLILSLISSAYAELVYSILFLMVLAQSLNLVFGFAGLVNLGHAAFVGMGAYTFAILVSQGFNPYIAIFVGGLSSCALALIIGFVVFRVRELFFPIATAILATAIPYFIIGTGVAGGYYGITLYLYVGLMYNPYILLFILFALSIIITFITFRWSVSPFGYALKALREDYDAAQTAGVNIFRCRLVAFILCAFFPGVVGGIMGFKTFWVTPSGAFNMMYSGESILVTLLGGSGSVFGPVIGSLIYEVLKDILMRYAPGFQMLIFSFLVIIIVLFAPEGVVGYLRGKVKRIGKILV